MTTKLGKLEAITFNLSGACAVSSNVGDEVNRLVNLLSHSQACDCGVVTESTNNILFTCNGNSRKASARVYK